MFAAAQFASQSAATAMGAEDRCLGAFLCDVGVHVCELDALLAELTGVESERTIGFVEFDGGEGGGVLTALRTELAVDELSHHHVLDSALWLTQILQLEMMPTDRASLARDQP